MDLELKKLKGKVIENIHLSEDGENVLFSTNTQEYLYSGYGDCQSTVYVSDIVTPENILGEELIKVEKLYLSITIEACNINDGLCEIGFNKKDIKKIEIDGFNVLKNETYLTPEKIYGVKFVSKKGICLLIYRNRSNNSSDDGNMYCCEYTDLRSINNKLLIVIDGKLKDLGHINEITNTYNKKGE